jgi:hypothetical protein
MLKINTFPDFFCILLHILNSYMVDVNIEGIEVALPVQYNLHTYISLFSEKS